MRRVWGHLLRQGPKSLPATDAEAQARGGLTIGDIAWRLVPMTIKNPTPEQKQAIEILQAYLRGEIKVIK